MSDGVPKLSNLDSTFSGDVLASKKERMAAMKEIFATRYGAQPDAIVRAPGRVNLIGEHIDYHGYSVLPMAIEQDVMIAVGCGGGDTVRVSNVETRFPEETVPVDPNADVPSAHKWTNYVHCGYKGAQLLLPSGPLPAPAGFALLVDGRVPTAAGLSSSSALVVASGLAAATARGTDVTRTGLADAARRAERFVGVMGGGMDQAISCLAEAGSARHIEFNPLRAESVSLPVGVSFVVANSLAKAEKAVTAVTGYNKRVVEGRMAGMVVGKAEGVADWRGLSTLKQLQEAVGQTPGGMAALLRKHLREGPYSKAEVAEALGEAVTQAAHFADRPLAAAVLEANDDFHLLSRALHVYEETHRVLQFRDLCAGTLAPADVGAASTATALGALMTASHASCRDLYDCSCPELDEIVATAVGAGALGSRLTGAGWGGCTVSVVADDQVPAVLEALRALYAKRGVSEEEVTRALFVTAPGPGAAVFTAGW